VSEKLIVVGAGEPKARFSRMLGKRWFMVLWFRPTDFCVGVQLTKGGPLITVWPITFGILLASPFEAQP